MSLVSKRGLFGVHGWCLSVAFAFILPFFITCKPSISVVKIVGIRSVQTRSLGASGLVLDLRVAVQNPNASAVRVTGMDLRVGFGGPWIATGTSRTATDLPGNGVGEFEIRISVPWERVSHADMDAILCAEIPYKVEGTVSIDSPLRMSNIPVSVSGRYFAAGALHITIQPGHAAFSLIAVNGVNVSDIGLARQKGLVEVTLDNPLKFEVPIARVDYQVDAGGTTVARGSLKHLALQPGRNKIQIPLAVSLLDIGLSALRSLLGGGLPAVSARGVLVLGEPGRELTLGWECEPE